MGGATTHNIHCMDMMKVIVFKGQGIEIREFWLRIGIFGL